MRTVLAHFTASYECKQVRSKAAKIAIEAYTAKPLSKDSNFYEVAYWGSALSIANHLKQLRAEYNQLKKKF